MQLNRSLQLIFNAVPTNDLYRVVTSEDGVHWTDAEIAGKQYQRDAANNITITVDHFSYFALLSTTATLPPPACTISISPSTAYNGDPVSLTWSIQNAQTGMLLP
jgi:hypothetical protein